MHLLQVRSSHHRGSSEAAERFIGLAAEWTDRFLWASTVGDDTWDHLLSTVRTGSAVIGSLRRSRAAFG